MTPEERAAQTLLGSGIDAEARRMLQSIIAAAIREAVAEKEAENKRLREALKRIVDNVSTGPSGDVCQTFDFEDARAALRGET